jgi:hypothetical protein
MPDYTLPDYPLPSFLAPRADEHEPQFTLEQELQSSSGILRASIFSVAVAVGGIAVALFLGHPVRVLADATASLSDNSDLQRGANPSPPAVQQAADTRRIQSSADARSFAPAALIREDMAALAELTNQALAGSNEPESGALLGQFQAWAAKQDAQAQERAQAEEPVQPVEAAPVQMAQDDPAPEEIVQRHTTTSSLRNARAEMPHAQKPKARIQRRLAARRQAAPIQDARAEQQPVPNAQQPSFLQSLGLNQ